MPENVELAKQLKIENDLYVTVRLSSPLFVFLRRNLDFEN
jgi:hypothetical protein